jgi:hypothetical protein
VVNLALSSNCLLVQRNPAQRKFAGYCVALRKATCHSQRALFVLRSSNCHNQSSSSPIFLMLNSKCLFPPKPSVSDSKPTVCFE